MPNESATDWDTEIRWGLRAQVLDSIFPDRKYALLPLLPIWPGFAINTLFYTAMLWLLFAFPFKLRRWRRINRGLCAKCAYPVGASDVCTECGAHIGAKSRIRGSMGLPPPATPAPGSGGANAT